MYWRCQVKGGQGVKQEGACTPTLVARDIPVRICVCMCRGLSNFH